MQPSADADDLSEVKGIGPVYRARLERTASGWERTLATNHLGHFLLTRKLESHLRSAGSRIVLITSKAHESGRLHRRPLDEILRGPPDYRGFGAYADSKLANVLFVRELARRWGSNATPIAVHPGLLASKIWDRNRTVAMWFVRRLTRFMRDPADARARIPVGAIRYCCDTSEGLRPDVIYDWDLELPPDAEVAEIATAPGWRERRGAYVNRTVPVDATLPDEAERLGAELWDRSAEAVGLRD